MIFTFINSPLINAQTFYYLVCKYVQIGLLIVISFCTFMSGFSVKLMIVHESRSGSTLDMIGHIAPK